MNTNRSEPGVTDIMQPARPGPSQGEPSLDGSIEQSIGRTLARVQELTLAEVEAMALFAMASGIGIGAEIAEILQVCAGRSSGGQARDPPVVVFSGEVRPGEMVIGDDG